MSSSMGRIIPYIMENNPNVPNHQPDKLRLHLLCSDAQIHHNTPYIKLLEEYYTHIPMIFPIIANSITLPGSMISIPNTSIEYVIPIRSPYIHNMFCKSFIIYQLYSHYVWVYIYRYIYIHIFIYSNINHCIYVYIYIIFLFSLDPSRTIRTFCDDRSHKDSQVAILKLLHTRPAKTARTWVKNPHQNTIGKEE